MNRKNKTKLIILIFIFIGLTLIIYPYNYLKNKNIDKIKLKNKITKKQFMMYKEDPDPDKYGNYLALEQFDSIPLGYEPDKVNEKFKCYNQKGEEIDKNNISCLVYGRNLYLKSNETMRCNLCFKLKPIMKKKGTELGVALIDAPTKGLNKTQEDGMYRYQGNNDEVVYKQPEGNEVSEDNDGVHNYICFGTSDMEECKNNPDKYMYRIIGIEDVSVVGEEGLQPRVKLIKKESIGDHVWYNDGQSPRLEWPNSTLKADLNGTFFLTNTTYVPAEWKDSIENVNWKYNTFGTDENGNWLDIGNTTAHGIYEIEEAPSTLPIVEAKIGLMKLHDYYYAGNEGGHNCSYSNGQYVECKKSWMHLSNNMEMEQYNNEWEWAMSTQWLNEHPGYASCIKEDGSVNFNEMNNTLDVRPVFYLNSFVKYENGDGTIDYPIIIKKVIT